MRRLQDFLESQAGTMLVLLLGLLVFACMTVLVAWTLPANEKVYALLAGITGGFSGALFMFIRLKTDQK